MNILIQPLDPRGAPIGEPVTRDWLTFLDNNDGFSMAQAADMRAVLCMGSGYLLGGGAAGAYRLSKMDEPDTDDDYERLLDQDAANEAERLSYGDV